MNKNMNVRSNKYVIENLILVLITCAICSLHLSSVLNVILHKVHENTSIVFVVFDVPLLTLVSSCFLVYKKKVDLIIKKN